MASTTGKTFDDYRDIIKQLKFKVKKQQTEISELQEENQKMKTMTLNSSNNQTVL